MLIKWYKNIAFLGAILWVGLGVLAIGSIVLSTLGWGINVVVGLLFILIGFFLYLRAKNFYRFYGTITTDVQNNPYMKRFMRLDMVLVLGTSFLGALFLVAAISRVFGEGYALFG